MDGGVLTALLSFAGTAVGALAGVLTSTRLTNYRIQQLEKKVEAHNNLVTRTYALESWREVCDEKIKVINHRVGDLENGM
jgi:hypothetical protein